MLQGYPFYGTGAASPTADNSTIIDPILEASVTVMTERGSKKNLSIVGISFNSDAPALGSRLEIRLGNQPIPAHVVDLLPVQDADLVTDNPHVKNFIDLGGIPIQENEFVDIRFVDPGAAELCAGVLWVEDFEPTIKIPQGRITSVRIGGTNDAGTSLAVTGADMDSRKLQDKAVYTPFMVVVRPEDKVVQAFILRAGKDSMTLPGHGTMVYPHAPLQFTGSQWNNGQVIGKVQVQAATKVEAIVYMIESFPEGSGPSEVEIIGNPAIIPGLSVIGQLQGKTTSTYSSRPSVKRPFLG